MWVPSHVGVSGNESADFLARAVTNFSNLIPDSSSQLNISIPCSDVITLLKKRSIDIWKRHWNCSVQLENKGLWYAPFNVSIGTTPWFCKGSNITNRKFYSTILRLRFGHCRLNYHLYRLKMVDSPHCNYCYSVAEQSLSHVFFDCPSFGTQRLVLKGGLAKIYGSWDLVPRSIHDLLINVSTYSHLYKFVVTTVGQL
jgi:hypothetical protein